MRNLYTRKTWGSVIVAGVAVVLGSGPTYAACTITPTSATSTNLGNNVCQYTVKGTQSGCGSNYNVGIELDDNIGGQITFRQVVVHNAAGTWAKQWQAPCGAVLAKIFPCDDQGQVAGTNCLPEQDLQISDVADNVGGACCIGMPDQECVDHLTLSECTGISGRYDGDGTRCAMGYKCIPTITNWGIVVMTLVTLAAATIVIMRRRAQAHS